MKTKEGDVMDIKRQGQLVEVLGSEMSNKYSATNSFDGRFLIPEPVVKFFHDGRKLEISPNKDEDPYAAIARYVFELNDEIEKLKSELAKAKAVPEGFVLVKKELPEQIAEKMAIDREWTDIKDKLPPFDNDGARPCYRLLVSLTHGTVTEVSYWGKGEFYLNGSLVEGVKYWMLLPNSPI